MHTSQHKSGFIWLALLLIIYKVGADGVSTPSSTGPDDLCLTSPSYGLCSLMQPRWFFNSTSSKCHSFTYSGCGGNLNKFISEFDCVTRCGPNAIHCGTFTCPSQCQTQMGDNGVCNVCVCSDSSCQGVSCGSNEVCRMIPGQCLTPVESCYERPSCRPIIEPTTARAVPCPLLDCVNFCKYGISKDVHGCDTCQCYDPCLGYECPENQKCMMTVSECDEGSECRDGSLRYCADMPVTAPMIPGPSSEELLQCCQHEGVSSQCQSLCVANLTLTDNVNLVMMCTDDIGKYLKCASNDKSVANCCERKLLSPSCLSFCYGNVNVTAQTNYQDYTQCIMNDGFNGVLSCYQQSWIAPTSAMTTPTRIAVPNVSITMPCPMVMCMPNCRIAIQPNGCTTCECTSDSPSTTSTSTTTTTLATTILSTTLIPTTTTTTPTTKVFIPTTTTSTTTTTTTTTPTTTTTTTPTTTTSTIKPSSTFTTTTPTTTTTTTTTTQAMSRTPTTTTSTIITAIPFSSSTTQLASQGLSSSSTTAKLPTPSTTSPSTMQGASSIPLPCLKQQSVDRETFQNNLEAMPQLNCNSLGKYQPLQCVGDSCRCVSQEGVTVSKMENLTLAEAIDKCYPNGKTTGTLKIKADFGIILPGTEGDFKLEMSQQIANLLKVNDSMVTVSQLAPGSVLVSFIVDGPSDQMTTVQENINALQNSPTSVRYGNESYEANLLSYNAAPSTLVTEAPAMDRETFLLIVILVPVLGSVLILFIVVGIICFCQARKRDSYKRQSLVSQYSTTSTQFDMVKEQDNQKLQKSKSQKSGRPQTIASQFSTTPLQSDTTGDQGFSGCENKSYGEFKNTRLSGGYTIA